MSANVSETRQKERGTAIYSQVTSWFFYVFFFICNLPRNVTMGKYCKKLTKSAQTRARQHRSEHCSLKPKPKGGRIVAPAPSLVALFVPLGLCCAMLKPHAQWQCLNVKASHTVCRLLTLTQRTGHANPGSPLTGTNTDTVVSRPPHISRHLFLFC